MSGAYIGGRAQLLEAEVVGTLKCSITYPHCPCHLCSPLLPLPPSLVGGHKCGSFKGYEVVGICSHWSVFDKYDIKTPPLLPFTLQVVGTPGGGDPPLSSPHLLPSLSLPPPLVGGHKCRSFKGYEVVGICSCWSVFDKYDIKTPHLPLCSHFALCSLHSLLLPLHPCRWWGPQVVETLNPLASLLLPLSAVNLQIPKKATNP